MRSNEPSQFVFEAKVGEGRAYVAEWFGFFFIIVELWIGINVFPRRPWRALSSHVSPILSSIISVFETAISWGWFFGSGGSAEYLKVGGWKPSTSPVKIVRTIFGVLVRWLVLVQIPVKSVAEGLDYNPSCTGVKTGKSLKCLSLIGAVSYIIFKK